MTDEAPWYRHFWPWFLIAITGSAVLGGMLTLMVAVNNPDYLVVSDTEYQQIRSELKADPLDRDKNEQGPAVERDDSTPDPEPKADPTDPDDGN